MAIRTSRGYLYPRRQKIGDLGSSVLMQFYCLIERKGGKLVPNHSGTEDQEDPLSKGRGMASRRRLTAAFLIFVAAAMSSASGRFIVETNSIKVISPKSIAGSHEAAIANFGVPNYGGSLTGVVLHPDEGTTGCNTFSTTFKSNSNRPVILLLDRGDCYFALKSWNGQQAGAAAVLIADSVDEALLTMDNPEESTETDYLEKITIPSALITREVGDSLKSAFENGSEAIVKLDWTESLPHPDERVEYEFWTNSNDECGDRCNEQMNFVKNFKGHAQLLEKGGYTMFTPHYITWYCPEAFILTKQCQSQCINHGRYCAPDPEQDFGEGYDGKDVLIENLRQLCVHRVANTSGRPWVWWDFVSDYHIRCSMKANNYSKQCAEDVVTSLGLPKDEISKCMGDPEADAENPVLQTEQELQVGHGNRGDITILPTVAINNVQYRGKLERTAVLRAICAGFKEAMEPPVCLSSDIETNECLSSNGGCWQNTALNITACKDTFRGRICECPVVNNVQYEGDGYTTCTAIGPGRCAMNSGGCWSESKDGQTLSACIDSQLSGCRCPDGFRGDGYQCQDIDECKEKLACNCPECSCKNTWGGFECKCSGNSLYIKGQDTCIAKNISSFGWIITALVLSCVAGAGLAGYIFYKYRIRTYMDSEIMAIMSQYMPLDSQQGESHPMQQESAA